MRIGFVTNKLTLRGAEVCLYDYADYNEKILGNSSIIICRSYEFVSYSDPQDVHEAAYDKFSKRFSPSLYYYENPTEIPELVKLHKIDVLFIEKAGAPWDGLDFDCCPTIIHAIFTTQYPHGSLYCPISPFLNKYFNTSYPVLPYMVQIHPTQKNLREELKISSSARVFASYGGKHEFDTYYVKRAICEFVKTSYAEQKDCHFIFMNHSAFGQRHPRLHFLEGSADMERKRKFINTADAMIYGRKEGETFGLAIAEFALAGKPILVSQHANARFHLDILGEHAIRHSNGEDLLRILAEWPNALDKNPISRDPSTLYKIYTPEYVMRNFNEILRSLLTSSDGSAPQSTSSPSSCTSGSACTRTSCPH